MAATGPVGLYVGHAGAKYSVKRLAAAVLVMAAIALFVNLGLWQLRRAEDKRALLNARSEQTARAPLTLLPGDKAGDGYRYRRVSVAGRYDAVRQVLLDNQVYNGRAGYQVLTPLSPKGGGCAVLVNRGWVPAAPSRSELPTVAIAEADAQVEGIIDHFPSVGLRLKGADQLGSGYPVVVQAVDAAQLSGRFGYCLQPYQILLAPEAGDGYVREWRMQHIDPDKSLGYAFQWFAMAAGLAAYASWIAWRHRPGQSI